MTRTRTYLTVVALLAAIIAAVTLASKGMADGKVSRPLAAEFGNGPRTSAQALYIATLKPADALRPRKMYTLQVDITDAAGQPVENAAITVDGGMPQHGHGLPTRPRVTSNPRSGNYEISGLRFNMGGWWVLTLSITTPSGSDTVTFNLAL